MSSPGSGPDARYARGEISREEWAAQRSTAAGAPAVPPRAAPGGKRILLLVAVVLLAAVVVTAVLWSLASSPAGAWNPSYGTAQHMHAADLASLNASATHGMAFAANDSLWFSSGAVNLVVYMSPPDHDMTFVIQGLVSPAVHVAAGTRVTLTEVNMDGDMYHNWALTTAAPPFSSMPLMGGGTMGHGSMMSMAMLSPASGGMYWSQSMTFTAKAGSYWYLCEYVGHAADGMYGSFVVG